MWLVNRKILYMYFRGGIARVDRQMCSVSSRGLTTGSSKAIFNTNNFSILSWIMRSSRGMTQEKLIHATTSSRGSSNDIYRCSKISQSTI